jgi:hypothetical protein
VIAEEKCIAPERDTEDWATLAAWYSGFPFWEAWRKVVLAQCREIIRAKHVDVKISEARIDDLARLHPIYLDFLRRHLEGRQLWEHEHKQAGGLP